MQLALINIAEIWQQVAGFAVVIFVFGAIVAVHEWGHMMAAKLCGVAVPEFAIGMGPAFLKIPRGETIYQLCWLPIGGFVRIAGLVGDDTTDGRTFPFEKQWGSKNGWQKAFILAAGALMNFVLAIITVLVMGWAGFPTKEIILTAVESGRPAAEAGLKSGDIVTRIDGHSVSSARQFAALVQARKDSRIPVEYIRDGQEGVTWATPRVMPDFNHSLASLGVGLAEDLVSTGEVSLIQPKSEADKLNLRVGDRVVSVGGREITRGTDVYLALPATDLETLGAIDEDGNPIPEGGGTPIELVIERPAAALGYEFNAEGKAVDGKGQPITDSRAPRLLDKDEEKARLAFTLPGDTNMVALGLSFKPELKRLPLGESLSRSMEDASNMMLGMFFSLRMMFTPEGAKSISGPVGIVRIIKQSASSDWYTFLQIFMLINLNLGLMNLLPLPALDGGRLVFVALKGIGIRINEKREALVHAVGMVMLLSLIGIVTFTDVLALF
ncbi:site-2 protease family protein [bacterium]|nr:site-2 protease family protein [bacterium]